MGCFFASVDPSEHATLANQAVEIFISSLARIKNISIIRLEAPIILTGFAALSVETQKYFFCPHGNCLPHSFSCIKYVYINPSH